MQEACEPSNLKDDTFSSDADQSSSKKVKQAKLNFGKKGAAENQEDEGKCLTGNFVVHNEEFFLQFQRK